MARTQFCRNITPEKLRACGASERVIKELQDVGFFCIQHPAFAQTKTRPIKRLMRIPDPEIKEKAISSIEKSLESGKSPVTGKFTGQKAVTEKEVKKVIEKLSPGEKVTVPIVTPTEKTNEINFPALICFQCREVRNHNCTVNKVCPVCGAQLKKVTLRIFEGF